MKTTFFTIVIVGLMIMVVVSLVRGIIAFLQGTKLDLERDPSDGPSANQLLQNKMMFARIKWQALAVVVVGVLLAISR
jgi:Hypoxia induced protein conserved region